MNWNASTIENLRRVFTEGFTARDIAEPLVSFDAATAALEVLDLMNQRNFDVVGLRKDGVVIGYAEREHLCGSTCGEQVRAIDAPISDSASLADVVLGLAEVTTAFCSSLGCRGWDYHDE